jgi:hypothetical protein
MACRALSSDTMQQIYSHKLGTQLQRPGGANLQRSLSHLNPKARQRLALLMEPHGPSGRFRSCLREWSIELRSCHLGRQCRSWL